MNVKLLVVHGRPAGKGLLLVPGEYYLGRGPECHVRFNSDWVSRQHCLLRVEVGGVWLRDLASRNGTLVNGSLCEGERRLADGDLLQVGPVVFKVRLEPEGPEDSSALPEWSPTLHPESGEPAARDPSLDSTKHHPNLDDAEPDM
jgi:pSer/pThr/pTyr-binding forkhead associated (FHA) protein